MPVAGASDNRGRCGVRRQDYLLVVLGGLRRRILRNPKRKHGEPFGCGPLGSYAGGKGRALKRCSNHFRLSQGRCISLSGLKCLLYTAAKRSRPIRRRRFQQSRLVFEIKIGGLQKLVRCVSARSSGLPEGRMRSDELSPLRPRSRGRGSGTTNGSTLRMNT
jgi:hypothetical protein